MKGFAVAALAHRDYDGEAALAGLTQTSPLRAAVAMALEVGRDGPSRRAFLHATLRRPEIVSDPTDRSDLARRARGLLASVVDPQLGRAWLREALLPRAGYVPEPQLIAYLIKRAAMHGAHTAKG